jgi:hypothetical protein
MTFSVFILYAKTAIEVGREGGGEELVLPKLQFKKLKNKSYI